MFLRIEKAVEDIGNLFGEGGNPIHVVLLVCLRVENSNPVEQLVVVVRLVRIEGNAHSNPRSGKQLCALAVMLKIWGSEGPRAVVFIVLMGAEQQGKRRLLLKFFSADLSVRGSWRNKVPSPPLLSLNIKDVLFLAFATASKALVISHQRI